MPIKLSNFNHLIFNYYPGAAGDLLVSALLDMDLSLNQAHRNCLPYSLYQIKSFEKTHKPYHWDRSNKDWFCDELIRRDMYMPQSCHYVSFLDSDHMKKVTEMYKVYQIMVEPKHRLKVEFFNFIKNAPGNNMGIEELQHKINTISTKFIDRYHQITSNVIDDLNVISFERLFYPPFDDFRMLYLELRKCEPDLEAYKKRTEKSLDLPRFLNVLGHDIEIDIENYSIRVL